MPPSDFIIEPVTAETVPEYVALRHLVFAPTINKILYSKQHEPSQATMARVAADISDGLEKGIMYLLCREKATGTLVAGARWRDIKPADANARERTWEEVEKGLEMAQPYPESDVGAWNDVFGQFNAGKRDILGTRPYFVLDTLVTHPEHHRRGAGGLLIAWGCERADQKGVEAYLEASPMGQPLYARYGFEPAREMRLDMRQYGGDEVFEFVAMRRPAQGEVSR
ncbi:acyl-CoA N-acyltransferase [Polyplosphaeria fusca]|uniref:Acyl-CoA N-acyltransferase n=1 Tax=Polyplosphaeria fusca TaxID=682080 RepID=A0A9P4R232_9PLEO|nr:acyl-CoA N-acyltransferase [Polyplosphaeria fusca]